MGEKIEVVWLVLVGHKAIDAISSLGSYEVKCKHPRNRLNFIVL